MNVVGIDHVQLAIPPGGEAQARAFYSGVLGFAEVPKPAAMLARAGGMWFVAGPLGIHIGIEPDMRPSVKAHPALVVDDLDGFVAGAERRDARNLPRAHLGSFRQSHRADPALT